MEESPVLKARLMAGQRPDGLNKVTADTHLSILPGGHLAYINP